MTDQSYVEIIQAKEEDYSRWYLDIVKKADLMDYGPVKGTMIMKPYGYAIWERMQRELDDRIKATGHQNAYFPLLIPKSYLEREMDHVEGFAPEVAWVTKGGNEELEEPLVIRPTSETIICAMMSKWIQSYRDLPLKLNQWANVMRWEKTTRPFLRTSEFLWQEGHTAHATYEEAEEEAMTMLGVYQEFAEHVLAIPVVPGQKTENEKFAGADHTYSLEALMSDGKALQFATSHHLGQHFAEPFEIQYTDKDNQLHYVYQTSWGASTRMIGGLIMTHSDNRGLVLPPRIAPIQVVIVPIFAKQKDEVLAAAQAIRAQLAERGIRVHLDDREAFTPGWKFNEYELKGVPVRIELGPKDLAKNQVVIARRDTGEKEAFPIAELAQHSEELLETIQQHLYDRASNFVKERTWEVKDLQELSEVIEKERGFYQSWWCGDIACLDEIKDKTSATARNLPFAHQREGEGTCICCGKKSTQTVFLARAY